MKGNERKRITRFTRSTPADPLELPCCVFIMTEAKRREEHGNSRGAAGVSVCHIKDVLAGQHYLENGHRERSVRKIMPGPSLISGKHK
jgi:hypothetical protein